MTSRLCELEAAEGARPIVDGYDPATDRWSFSFDGPFWKALEHAHSLGKLGAGVTVAVIDTGCNRAIPSLHQRVTQVRCVPAPLPLENTDHGSAVALLIAKVAPECQIDLYAIQRSDGTIEPDDVAQAVSMASQSGAQILNLSLGAEEKVPDIDEMLQSVTEAEAGALMYGPAPQHARTELLNRLLPHTECGLCNEASSAVKQGKLVFAAAGNHTNGIFCPARAEDVVAVGFQARSVSGIDSRHRQDYFVDAEYFIKCSSWERVSAPTT